MKKNKNVFRLATINMYVEDVNAYFQYLREIFGFRIVVLDTSLDCSISATVALSFFAEDLEEEDTSLRIRIIKQKNGKKSPSIVFGLRLVDMNVTKEEGLDFLKESGIELGAMEIDYSFGADTFSDTDKNTFHLEDMRLSELVARNNALLEEKYGIELCHPEAIGTSDDEGVGIIPAYLRELIFYVSSLDETKKLFVEKLGFELLDIEVDNNTLLSFKIAVSPDSEVIINFKQKSPDTSLKNIIGFSLDSFGVVDSAVFDFAEELGLTDQDFNTKGDFAHESLKLVDPAGFEWIVKS